MKCQKHELTADVFNTNKAKKDVLSQWLETGVDLLNNHEIVVRHLLGIVDQSKTELIAAQQKVVKLQEDLLEKKNEQLVSLQSDIKTTVQDTVETEIRSYSSVVTSAPPSSPLCENNLKTAVRTAIEEEDRSKNLVIYGLKEDTGEHLSEKVSSIFEALGEKPRVEVCRIGRETTEQVTRPVKVVFSNSTCSRQILSKSKNLRQVVPFKSVYVCPDRSLEERQIHRQLVLDLKKKKEEEPGHRHFIRNGKLCSEERTKGES